MHLAGGAALILASLLIGILYNTLIGNKIQLVPTIATHGTVNAAGSDTSVAPAMGDSLTAAESTTAKPAAPPVPEGVQGFIPLDKAKALYDGKVATFIDARSVESYGEGHIPGAINIPYDQLVDYYETLTSTVPLDQLVVVYCWSPTCDFSDTLASEMVYMGYTTIVIFRGGWDEWHEAGFPAEGSAVEK